MDAFGARSRELGTTHDDMLSVAKLTATLASGTGETVDVLTMRSERARKAEASTNADKRLGVNREIERHVRAGFDQSIFTRDNYSNTCQYVQQNRQTKSCQILKNRQHVGIERLI